MLKKDGKLELMKLARRKSYLFRCIKVIELVEQYENEFTIRVRIFEKYIKPIMGFSYVTFNNMLNEKNPIKEIEAIDKEMEKIRSTTDFKYKHIKKMSILDFPQFTGLLVRKKYLNNCINTQQLANSLSVSGDINSKLFDSEFKIKFGCVYRTFNGRMNETDIQNQIESIDSQIKEIKMKSGVTSKLNDFVESTTVHSTPKRALIIESVVPVDGGW